jgi:hypothetical protein
MGQFKQEEVKGVVRNSDSTHTAILSNGERRVIDSGETSSLMNRLDKDRSRMEKEGTRSAEREPETRDESRRVREVRDRDAKLRSELSKDPRFRQR